MGVQLFLLSFVLWITTVHDCLGRSTEWSTVHVERANKILRAYDKIASLEIIGDLLIIIESESRKIEIYDVNHGQIINTIISEKKAWYIDARPGLIEFQGQLGVFDEKRISFYDPLTGELVGQTHFEFEKRSNIEIVNRGSHLIVQSAHLNRSMGWEYEYININSRYEITTPDYTARDQRELHRTLMDNGRFVVHRQNREFVAQTQKKSIIVYSEADSKKTQTVENIESQFRFDDTTMRAGIGLGMRAFVAEKLMGNLLVITDKWMSAFAGGYGGIYKIIRLPQFKVTGSGQVNFVLEEKPSKNTTCRIRVKQ